MYITSLSAVAILLVTALAAPSQLSNRAIARPKANEYKDGVWYFIPLPKILTQALTVNFFQLVYTQLHPQQLWHRR